MTGTTRPLLRQIENLQATLGGQTESWEKLEKSISDRLGTKEISQLLNFSLFFFFYHTTTYVITFTS